MRLALSRFIESLGQSTVSGDGGGGLPASIDGAVKRVEAVRRGEADGLGKRFTFRVKG